MSDTDLSDLDIIADDHKNIKAHKITVQKMATHSLTAGLQNKDRGQVCLFLKKGVQRPGKCPRMSGNLI